MSQMDGCGEPPGQHHCVFGKVNSRDKLYIR